MKPESPFLCVFSLFAILFFSLPARADRIFIEPVSETPPELDGKTVAGLVRSSLVNAGHQVAEQRELSDYSLQASVAKLGTAYLVAVERREKNKAVQATQLKARALEEMDEIVPRVVRAVLAGIDAAGNARVGDVTIDEENKGNRRKQARSVKSLLTGVAFLGHLGTSTPAYYLGFNPGWEFGGSIRAGFKSDFALSIQPEGPAAIFSNLVLNVAYYPMEDSFSPFLGVEYGFGFVRDAVTRGLYGGMSLGGTAGVAVLRTYSASVELGVRGAALLNTALAQTPLLAAIWLGITF